MRTFCMLQGLPYTASDVNGRLTIRAVGLSDAGEYVCSAIGVPGDYRASASLIVDPFGELRLPPVSTQCSFSR